MPQHAPNDRPSDKQQKQRTFRNKMRRPGKGWRWLGSSVWEHTSGLRIHGLGRMRLPDGTSRHWTFEEEHDALRQQGYNIKRALMVWALSLLPPNHRLGPAQK